jgi:hypothetical protein
MFTIPNDNIPKVNNYSDKAGDFTKTFSLDLSREYGSIIPSKMKAATIESGDLADLREAAAFAFHDSKIFFASTDYAWSGGDEMTSTFAKTFETADPNGEPNPSYSDIAIFNGYLYLSGSDEIMKRDPATDNWSTPVTTQLTAARPHLMAVLGTGAGASRLYVTDDYTQVHSVSTADAIAATGSYTMNLGLSSEWTITMLEAGNDLLWIGCLNKYTGAGYMFSWDGATENTPQQSIPLVTGVVAGTVLNGIPYYLDTRGVLYRYAGASFVEVDRLNFKTPYLLEGAGLATNLRFIHPNGMTITDRGTILMFIKNNTEVTGVADDTCPSGVYEYDPNIGLYHKYALSDSTDGGMVRLANVGALFYYRSTGPSSTGNGTLLASAQYYTESGTAYGIFYDDSSETVQGYGYFITPKLFGNVQETWKTATSIYDELITAADKIVVKYRTGEKNSLTVEAEWLNATTFNTTTDVSDFEVGDEVTIVRGDGAGKFMTITRIEQSSTAYSITVDSNEYSSTGTIYVRFDNWKALPAITNKDNKQYSVQTLREETTSPWAQFKVHLYLTRKKYYKLVVDQSKNIS